MIFLRFLRMVFCMALTPFLWVIAISFLFIVNVGSCPMPSDVYFWLKKAITHCVTATGRFLKTELFGSP